MQPLFSEMKFNSSVQNTHWDYVTLNGKKKSSPAVEAAVNSRCTLCLEIQQNGKRLGQHKVTRNRESHTMIHFTLNI